MRPVRLTMVMVVSAAVSACTGAGDVQASTTTSDSDSMSVECDVVASDQLADASEPVPFHLWVSNQSFDVDPVDIEVYLDDQQVVCDLFRVESQHTWIEFEFELDEGEHSLRAVGLEGQVELVESFTVSDGHWGLVEFWTEEGRNFFTFHVQDEPIYFA